MNVLASSSHVRPKEAAVGGAATDRAATSTCGKDFDQLAAVGAHRAEAELVQVHLGGSSSSNIEMAVRGTEPPTVEGADNLFVNDEELAELENVGQTRTLQSVGRACVAGAGWRDQHHRTQGSGRRAVPHDMPRLLRELLIRRYGHEWFG